jgi:hypothetical protein
MMKFMAGTSARMHGAAMSGAVTLLPAAAVASPARAGGGILGLDHVVTLDDKGIWSRKYQLWLVESMLAAQV